MRDREDNRVKQVYIVGVYQRVANIVSSFWIEMMWVRSSEFAAVVVQDKNSTRMMYIINYVLISFIMW